MTRRLERVNDLLRQEISQMLIRELKDPRLIKALISITQVETSVDLGYAKVFVSVMGTPEEKEKVLEGLNSASGFLQRELRHRLSLRRTPRLHFYRDDSIEQSDRLARLLDYGRWDS